MSEKTKGGSGHILPGRAVVFNQPGEPDGHAMTPDEMKANGFPASIADAPGVAAWISGDGRFIGIDFSECGPRAVARYDELTAELDTPGLSYERSNAINIELDALTPVVLAMRRARPLT